MTFQLTESFQKKAQKMIRKNPLLRKHFQKQFSLFQQNPPHPSLKFHKLQGKRSTQYAMWVVGDLRAICRKEKDIFVFFELVTHDEY